MSSPSRADSDRMTSRSTAASERSGGGVRFRVAGPTGVLDPVASGPTHALPGLEGVRLDPEEPARLAQGRLQVLGAVLAEISDAHAGCDGHPLAADVGSLHELRVATAADLGEGPG